ncbi:MAG: STN domain-containing protein, partial [Sphingobacteriaceae bacterium]|nr:STN domain-containing protein [Cytophagaceae bacterium]
MKNVSTRSLGLILTLSLLLLAPAGMAQMLARNAVPRPAQERPADSTMPLHAFLADLQTRHGILFLYKSSELRERRVVADSKSDKVEKVLSRTLKPAGLKYKKVRNTYVIMDERD